MDYRFSKNQLEFIEEIEEIANNVFKPIEEEFGEQNYLSKDMVKALGEYGFYKRHIPERYGGSSKNEFGSATELCIIREELARLCPLAESHYSVTGLGSYPILLAGTEEQKMKYLPKMTTGEYVFAFTLTEPTAGSDAVNLKTTARLEKDEWVLNGEKTFISNAGDADVYVVFARTSEAPGSKGISAFIVEADTPGFELMEKLDMTAPHSIGTLAFKDCRIPKENLLGEEGRGFKYAMQTLDMFRSSVGAQLVGFARAALELGVNYAKEREAFGGPLTQFEAIRFKLADMYTEIQAAKNLVYYAAYKKDQGYRVTKEASMAKMFATLVAQKAAYESQQIFGGYGMIKGNPIEALYREVRAPAIYEGTTEIHHMIIGRGMVEGTFIDDSIENVFV